MNAKTAIQSQYLAALDMLHGAVSQCPDASWDDAAYDPRFWHVAYHALFFTHLYLQVDGAAFKPWPKHRDRYEQLGPTPWPPHEKPDIGAPYTRQEILEYLAFCRQEVEAQVTRLDMEAASGFGWLPFGKLELQFYNIRHLQHHVGQLAERLRTAAGSGVGWVAQGATEDGGETSRA